MFELPDQEVKLMVCICLNNTCITVQLYSKFLDNIKLWILFLLWPADFIIPQNVFDCDISITYIGLPLPVTHFFHCFSPVEVKGRWKAGSVPSLSLSLSLFISALVSTHGFLTPDPPTGRLPSAKLASRRSR